MTSFFISFVWAHQKDSEKWIRKFPLDEPKMAWTQLRYLLEQKFFRKSQDYIICIAPVSLKDTDFIVAGEDGPLLVLKRMPLDRQKGQRPYIPAGAASSSLLETTLTEEEKIMRVMQFTRESFQGRGSHICHPSQVAAQPIRIPAGNYECAYCLEKGAHYISHCPRKEQGLPSRKIPKGYPRSFLREAKTDEEKLHAYLTAEGKLVVPKVGWAT